MRLDNLSIQHCFCAQTHRGRGLCIWHLTCKCTQRLLCSTSYPLHPFHQGEKYFWKKQEATECCLKTATDQTFLHALYSQCFISITSQCRGSCNFHCNIKSTHGHASYKIQRKQVLRNYCN